MLWIYLILFIAVYFNALSGGFAIIVLAVITLFARSKRDSTLLPSPKQEMLSALIFLRLQLKQEYQKGQIEVDHYHYLLDQIDNLCGQSYDSFNAYERGQLLRTAWSLVDKPAANSTTSQQSATPIIPSSISEPFEPESIQPKPIVEPQPAQPTIIQPTLLAVKSIEYTENQSVDSTAPAELEEESSPGWFERNQDSLKNWVSSIYSSEFMSQIFIPFLWQNIGWFIGGFCFVSGSVFLVAYTEGFAKALVVFITLFLYTILLFWGGYQIRRHRPELRISSNVLFILGVLIVPLHLAAGVRLLDSGFPDFLFVGLAIILSVAAIAVFWFTVQVASGAIDRNLQKEHPQLLLGISVLQFSTPFITNWGILAGLHLILLGLLGYAFIRFAQHWLQSLFIDQQKTAYYAAGTLLFAALVSFVHMTWGNATELPKGYAAPFLMISCGLLFYVDTHLKQWVHKQVLLNHFTFVIYAISVIALLLTVPAKSLLIASLTLILGVMLYGLIIWYYLTLIPLYLLLICLGSLYGLWILRYFPYQWHFLLSLPGLSGLVALQRFAQYRQSVNLAIITCRILVGLATSLFIWSLYHSIPSVSAVITSLVAASLIIPALYIPTDNPYQCSKIGIVPKCYAIIGLITLSLAYMPLFMGDNASQQFNYSLLILAILWTSLGLYPKLKESFLAIFPQEVFINSVLITLFSNLLSVLLTLFFGLLSSLSHFIVILFITSGILLWLSLALRVRTLLYGALIVGGCASALLKWRYFPGTSATVPMILAILTWCLVWKLQKSYAQLNYSNEIEENVENTHLLTLLWLSPVYSHSYPNITTMVLIPLRNVLYFLWALGLGIIGGKLWLLELGGDWAIMAILGAIVTILIAGETRKFILLTLAVILLELACLSISYHQLAITQSWLPALGVLIGLAMWIFTLYAVQWTMVWQLCGWQENYGYNGVGKAKKVKVESIIHETVFSIIIIILISALYNLTPNFPLLIAVSIASLFFMWTGSRYYSDLHSYLVIICSSLAVFALYCIVTNTVAVIALAEPRITLVTATLAIILPLLADIAEKFKKWQDLYVKPLYHISALFYVISVFGGLYLLLFQFTTPWLYVLFILLTIGQLPLFRYAHDAPEFRGLCVPVLLSTAVLCLVIQHSLQEIAILWAFVLWGIGNYGLPSYNQRFPRLAIKSQFFPILGFIWVNAVPILIIIYMPALWESLYWWTVPVVTLYAFLILRQLEWEWLPNFVTVGLLASGLLVFTHFIRPFSALLVSIAVWINFLLYLSYFFERHDENAESPWKMGKLAEPLFIWCVLALSITLFLLSITTIAWLGAVSVNHVEQLVLTLLLNLSLLHALVLRPQSLLIHLLLISLLNSVLLTGWFNLPLLLTLWTAILLGISWLIYHSKSEYWLSASEFFLPILEKWLQVSFAAALVALLLMVSITVGERWSTLMLLTVLSFLIGLADWNTETDTWLNSSIFLFLLALHTVWWVWLSQAHVVGLLPWYALQDMVLAWGLYYFYQWVKLRIVVNK